MAVGLVVGGSLGFLDIPGPDQSTPTAIAQPSGDVSGPARVIDGDTIDISGTRIRLHGIDAPESRQTCMAAGVEWACGREATSALRRLLGSAVVACQRLDTDRWGRMIGRCYVGDTDINSVMVRDGWAVAYRRFSSDYVDAEAAARATNAGVWRGEFLTPEEWRRQN